MKPQYCERCGTQMLDLNACDFVCRNCGAVFDCES